MIAALVLVLTFEINQIRSWLLLTRLIAWRHGYENVVPVRSRLAMVAHEGLISCRYALVVLSNPEYTFEKSFSTFPDGVKRLGKIIDGATR